MARRRKDQPAITLRVTSAGFVPASLFDQEMHARYAIGSTVEADIHQDKSPDLLKLYFGFLDFVVKSTGYNGDRYSLSNALLAEGGYHQSYTALMGGGVHVIPASIADMDKQAFKEFAELAFAAIYEEFGIDVEAYKEHLRQRSF